MHATSITRAEKNSFDSQIAARRACDRDVVLLLHLPRCASRMINYEERVEESAAQDSTSEISKLGVGGGMAPAWF